MPGIINNIVPIQTAIPTNNVTPILLNILLNPNHKSENLGFSLLAKFIKNLLWPIANGPVITNDIIGIKIAIVADSGLI